MWSQLYCVILSLSITFLLYIKFIYITEPLYYVINVIIDCMTFLLFTSSPVRYYLLYCISDIKVFSVILFIVTITSSRTAIIRHFVSYCHIKTHTHVLKEGETPRPQLYPPIPTMGRNITNRLVSVYIDCLVLCGSVYFSCTQP